jgi:hypothetical protein
VPGIAVDEVEADKLLYCATARELRRKVTGADLAITDIAAVSRTILSALSQLSKGEQSVWQLLLCSGLSPRPAEALSLWQRLVQGQPSPSPTIARGDAGVVGAVIRLGASARTARGSTALVARLRQAAGSISAPGARLVPRLLPSMIVTARLTRAATPITTAPVLLRPEEVVGLMGWPVGAPLVPGLSLGGSPQLPASAAVPTTGRVLGRSTASERLVAQPLRGAVEHMLIIGPTGAGKSDLASRLFLDDIAAGRGGLVIDPKGGTADAIIERLPEAAIDRTIIVDPTDAQRPVPLPLLVSEAGGMPELAADTLVGLLRHRYRDLGPRSSDILSASLYALGHVPNATLMDLLRLWSEAGYRAQVAARVADDPVLGSFLAWFEGLGVAERNYILAAPLNKIRPLLQRPIVRNVLAAPRATFTLAEALRKRFVVIIRLPEGALGSDATSLLGQVVMARLWAAVQGRTTRSLYSVTIDEAPRFLDQPTDLGDVLARSREYGVATTIIAQSLAQFPVALRDIALNSARSKVAFGTSAADARRLADEFGPAVQPEFLSGLGRYEAMGAVSLGGTVSQPFTFATEALGAPVPGRAAAVRATSRERWGVPRAEIETSFRRGGDGDARPNGPVGRRKK